MKRRTFNAEFKAKIVLEVLRGEKELNVIAAENEIAPNQIRNWKSEFLKNAAAAFDDKKTEDLRTALKDKEHETDSRGCGQKVGQYRTAAGGEICIPRSSMTEHLRDTMNVVPSPKQ